MSLAYRTINNSLFNFLGWLWPIGLSLLATPYIVHHLGKDAYGILALVIAVLGYFALLDLGLSTATVKYIAEYHAVGNQKMLQKVISSNLLIFIVIGIGGGTLLAGVTPFLVNNVLRVPPSLADVAEFAFYIGAVGFLFTMMLGVLTAIPNALQRYDISNLLGIIIASATTLGTVGLLAAGFWLREVVLWNLFLSVLSVVLYAVVVRYLLPDLPFRLFFDWPAFRQSLNFGSMALIQRLSGTLLFQLDRFLIGALLGTVAVTFYVVPANLTKRIHSIVSRVTSIIFPLSSALHSTEQHLMLQRVYMRSAKFGLLAGSALAAPIAALSFPFLRYWMGLEFAQEGSAALTILALAYYMTSLTAVPSSVVHGIGRPEVNAFFSVGTGVLNVVFCLLLIPRFGLLGAAYANLTNGLVVPFYLHYVERHLLKLDTMQMLQKVYLGPMLLGAGILLFGTLVLAPRIGSLGEAILTILFSVILYGLLALILGIIDREDRLLLLGYMRSSFSQLRGLHPLLSQGEDTP